MATECLYLAVPSGSTNFSLARLQKALPAFLVSGTECRLEHHGKYVFLERLNCIPSDLEDENFQLPDGGESFDIYWLEFSDADLWARVLKVLASIDSKILMSSDWFNGPISDYQ